MKLFYFIAVIFIFFGGNFSLFAQDMIVLKNGNIIEAKVVEISLTEIKYRRPAPLDGPMIVIPKNDALSIRYGNGTVEVINSTSASIQDQQFGSQTPLQRILNAMPAIPIAGNNLKFEFTGDTWIAKVNGENFLAGTIEINDSSNGYFLILKQTHMWPGVAGRTASRIPGGSAISGALNTAGSVLSLAGAIEAAGPEIILEYKAGSSVGLSLVPKTRAAQLGIGTDTTPFDPIELNGNQALRNYLASVKPNTTFNPVQVTMLNINELSDLVKILRNSHRYINLDLSKCTTLKNINLPADVRFAKSAYLTGIILPDSITNIPTGAFRDCTNLASINIPNSAKTIDANAFSGCFSLTKMIIPDNVTVIGNSAFMNCYRLVSITISNSVKTIGANAFSGCSSLTNMIIPDSVTVISNSAFMNCSSLTSVVIPSSVKTIGANAFRRCDYLSNLTISGNTSIEDGAFHGCNNLTSVTFLGKIKFIRKGPSEEAAFPGDLISKYLAKNGGPGIYTRTNDSTKWTKP